MRSFASRLVVVRCHPPPAPGRPFDVSRDHHKNAQDMVQPSRGGSTMVASATRRLPTSHPTKGVALLGPNVFDRLSSQTVELPVITNFCNAYWHILVSGQAHRNIGPDACERVSSTS